MPPSVLTVHCTLTLVPYAKEVRVAVVPVTALMLVGCWNIVGAPPGWGTQESPRKASFVGAVAITVTGGEPEKIPPPWVPAVPPTLS